MITQDTPIEKQIEFWEGKINQYLDAIRVNPKGERCSLWIDWIKGWNNEIIYLKNEINDTKKMEQNEFNSWFEEVKKNAIEEFGYNENETSNFSEKNWEKFFNKKLNPTEAINQYLRELFSLS